MTTPQKKIFTDHLSELGQKSTGRPRLQSFEENIKGTGTDLKEMENVTESKEEKVVKVSSSEKGYKVDETDVDAVTKPMTAKETEEEEDIETTTYTTLGGLSKELL